MFYNVHSSTHYLFSGLHQVSFDVAYFSLKPLVLLPQQLLLLVHQPRHFVPVQLLARTLETARVQGHLQNVVL